MSEDRGSVDDRADPTPASTLAPAPPDPERWSRVPDDDFALVVAHTRRALADVDDQHLTPDVRRLRSTPASRLVRGNGRRRLLDALAAGGPLWVGTRTRLGRDPDLVGRLRAALEEPADDPDAARPDPDLVDLVDRVAELEQAREDVRAQRDQARGERDEARRQRDGAEGREASLRDELDRARASLAEAEAVLDQHRAELASAVEERAAAVAREGRRGQARRRDLEAELAAARRELDTLRRDRARPAEATSRARPTTTSASRQPPVGPARPPPPQVDRVRPGRPSRLPPGTRLDSREGAGDLVEAVGRVLVDGYNVTRTHRGDLDLAAQRDWLVNGLVAMASRRRVDVEVVFDAHREGRASGRRQGGVQVSYTHPGITADDEIVLAVEASDRDRPLVVVTDDRELRERLGPARVDLLPTASLVWLLG